LTATNGTTSPNSSVTMQATWINSSLTSALEPYADGWKENNRQQGGTTSQSGSSMSEQSAYILGRSSQSTGKSDSTGVSTYVLHNYENSWKLWEEQAKHK
jgi:hypothetical protein